MKRIKICLYCNQSTKVSNKGECECCGNNLALKENFVILKENDARNIRRRNGW